MLPATGCRLRAAASRALCLSGAILGLLCGLLVMNGVAGAQAASHTTTVSFTLLEAIEVLAWPSAGVPMVAGPDEEAISGPFVFLVRANAPWGIRVRTDADDGRMREYDPNAAAYVPQGHVLSRSVEWSTTPNGPWYTTTAADVPVVSGRGPTGAQPAAVEFYLRQVTTYDDVTLPTGREYRIVLTYTAGLGY